MPDIVQIDLSLPENRDLRIEEYKFKTVAKSRYTFEVIPNKGIKHELKSTTRYYKDYKISCHVCSKFFIWSSLKCSPMALSRHIKSSHSSESESTKAAIFKSKTHKVKYNTIDRYVSAENHTRSQMVQKKLENDLTNFFIDGGIPFRLLNSPHLANALKRLGYTLKIGGKEKLNDKIYLKEIIYKINVHEELQEINSISLMFDMWKAKDKNHTWFLCCEASFVDKNYNPQTRILDFMPMEGESHSGEYIAQKIKALTDAFNITYKIAFITVDSASNNISSSTELFRSLDVNSPAYIKRGMTFAGEKSLVRCASHIIHNAVISFNNHLEQFLSINSEETSNEVDAIFPDDLDCPITEEINNIIDLETNDNNDDIHFDDTTLREIQVFLGANEEYNDILEDSIELREMERFQNEEIITDISGFNCEIEQSYNKIIGENSFSVVDARLVIERTRSFVKNIRYHRSKWIKILQYKRLPVTVPSLDCQNRWSSTYLMLQYVLDNKEATLDYCQQVLSPFISQPYYSNYGKKDRAQNPIIDKEDFLVIESVCNMLKPFYRLTMMCGEKRAVVSNWRQIIRSLNNYFELYKDGKIPALIDDENNKIAFPEEDLKNLMKFVNYPLRKLAKYHRDTKDAHDLILAEWFNPVYNFLAFQINDYGYKTTESYIGTDRGDKIISPVQIKNEIIDGVMKEIWKDSNKKVFGNVNLERMKQEKLNYLADHQGVQIDSHPLDSPAVFDVDYPINESFEDLEKFKSLQNQLKKELLLSLHRYSSFRENSTPNYNNDENSNTTDSTSISYIDGDDSLIQFLNSNNLVGESIDGNDSDGNDSDGTYGLSNLEDTFAKEKEKLRIKLSKKTSFDENEEADCFLNEYDIEFECNIEWCLRKSIMKEIDMYLSFVTGNEFASELILRSKNENFRNNPGFEYDVHEFWRSNEKKFPFLSLLAKRMLSTLVSSVNIERRFSVSSNVITKRRCSLIPNTTRASIINRLNMRQLASDGNLVDDQKLSIRSSVFGAKYGFQHPFINLEIIRNNVNYYKTKTCYSLEEIASRVGGKS